MSIDSRTSPNLHKARINRASDAKDNNSVLDDVNHSNVDRTELIRRGWSGGGRWEILAARGRGLLDLKNVMDNVLDVGFAGEIGAEMSE
jgi:hypothetical protein